MISHKIDKLIGGCDKHLLLSAAAYSRLTEEDIEHIDQFLFRFAKLQDAIGEKLFVLFLEFLQEPNPKSKPYIDLLKRLEQRGWLEDKNVGLKLRKIRNIIAHQYEDEPGQVAETLNAMYDNRVAPESIYNRLKTRYSRVFGKTV
ncbi:MAG: hypothetical protein PHT19_06085 [Methylococcus sp.]|nr:hypothetical protein [Methylococcus sp.]